MTNTLEDDVAVSKVIQAFLKLTLEQRKEVLDYFCLKCFRYETSCLCNYEEVK